MASVQLKLNGKGIQDLLKAPGVQADLERRGRAVAAAAGEGHEVTARVGKTRARVSVRTATPEAMVAEATDRTLSADIDAARK